VYADQYGGGGGGGGAGMVGGVAGGVGASVGGVMSFAREQFERRFTDVSYDLLISKTFYFFFYAAFGYTLRPPAYSSIFKRLSSCLSASWRKSQIVNGWCQIPLHGH